MTISESDFYDAVERYAEIKGYSYYSVHRSNDGNKSWYKVVFTVFPVTAVVYLRESAVKQYTDDDYPILSDMFDVVIEQEQIKVEYLDSRLATIPDKE